MIRLFDLPTIEFTMQMTEAGTRRMAEFTQASREVRITLERGGVWPPTLRRGQAVDLRLGDCRLNGRVKFRRLRVLVVEGTIEREGG